jgi:hypothetical protein
VLIDADAAGFGWFVDATPHDDSEFGLQESDGGEMLLASVSKRRLNNFKSPYYSFRREENPLVPVMGGWVGITYTLIIDRISIIRCTIRAVDNKPFRLLLCAAEKDLIACATMNC